MRLTDEKLNKIKKKYNIDELWSFSRFDNYRTSSYEFFLKYIKHENPLGETSPYGILGNACHSILEDLYNNNIKYEDMADRFDTEYVTNVDVLGLKFNRTNEELDSKIRKKYYDGLLHFYKNYKPIEYNVSTEKPVVIKIDDDIVFIGYIDAIYKDSKGNYVIQDFKTSSLYKGKAIEQHSHQLTIYAEGLRQMGIDPNKISICWNFLRYVTVLYQQVNGKFTTSYIERQEIGSKLKSKAKVWLNKLGYKDQAEEYLNEMLVSNSIECLPEEVRNKFEIKDCYVEISNWQDIWKDLQQEIIATVGEIRKNTEEYNKTGNDKIWWDDDEHLKEQEYYLWNLTDYRVDQLKDFKAYLDRLNEQNEFANDLLGTTTKKNNVDDDMSWLEEI